MRSALIAACFCFVAYAANFDILELSQKPSDYVLSEETKLLSKKELAEKIFRPWSSPFCAQEKGRAEALKLLTKEGYGENLTPWSQKEKEGLTAYARELTKIDKIAITIRNADIRALPSKRAFFFDPSQVGEGFPFDYFQESRIYAQTPLKVLFATKDGAFYYVSNYVSDGWIDAREVLFLKEGEAEKIKKASLFATIKDKSATYDENGLFLEKMAVGSFLFRDDDGFFGATQTGIAKIAANDGDFAALPILFSQKAFSTLAETLMDEAYGWGGAFDNRDCSMFLRDLYLPFGVYLPRNSKEQADIGGKSYTKISMLPESQKADYISKNGLPFETLLYLKGHIMLYIGHKEGVPVVLHDVWGFAYSKDGKERRYVIGKPTISTLYLGAAMDGFEPNKSLAARVLGVRELIRGQTPPSTRPSTQER